jgi:hypothetical protein
MTGLSNKPIDSSSAPHWHALTSDIKGRSTNPKPPQTTLTVLPTYFVMKFISLTSFILLAGIAFAAPAVLEKRGLMGEYSTHLFMDSESGWF